MDINKTKTSLVLFIIAMICYGISLIPLSIFIMKIWSFSPMRLKDRINKELQLLKKSSSNSTESLSLEKQLQQLQQWLPFHNTIKELRTNDKFKSINTMITDDRIVVYGMMIWFSIMVIVGSLLLGLSVLSTRVILMTLWIVGMVAFAIGGFLLPFLWAVSLALLIGGLFGFKIVTPLHDSSDPNR